MEEAPAKSKNTDQLFESFVVSHWLTIIKSFSISGTSLPFLYTKLWPPRKVLWDWGSNSLALMSGTWILVEGSMQECSLVSLCIGFLICKARKSIMKKWPISRYRQLSSRDTKIRWKHNEELSNKRTSWQHLNLMINLGFKKRQSIMIYFMLWWKRTYQALPMKYFCLKTIYTI